MTPQPFRSRTIRRPGLSALAVACLWSLGCGSGSATGGHGGGSSGMSSGGSSGSGGVASSGGVNGSGGTAATGGVSGSGGPAASGGTVGSGGSAGTGGRGGSAGATGAAGTPGSGGRAGGGGAGKSGSGGATGGAPAGSGGGGVGGSGAAAKPSAGCSATTAPTPGRTTIDVSGTQREYILTLPANYDPKHPYRLIVAFHGGQYNDDWLVNGDPPQSGPYYGIQSEAKDAAIFVASQALSGSWTNQDGRDIDYVTAMVTRFKSQLCIDENRIFATGFSMGGIMTNTVACTQASLFRAVAAMSGRLPTTPATCQPDHPIAYWASHGMSDPTIPIADGQMARDLFMKDDVCIGQAVTMDANGCTVYQGCTAGDPVVWCPFDGVHQPPPFAGPAIWSFLSQF